jgi:hypothetical protein
MNLFSNPWLDCGLVDQSVQIAHHTHDQGFNRVAVTILSHYGAVDCESPATWSLGRFCETFPTEPCLGVASLNNLFADYRRVMGKLGQDQLEGPFDAWKLFTSFVKGF